MDDSNKTGADANVAGQHLRLVAGREIAFDREGFFWDYDDWSEDAAAELAAESGLSELLEIHWRVLLYFREFYEFNARTPLNRDLKKGTGISLLELKNLFPGGLKEGARRLAGLPNPKTCS